MGGCGSSDKKVHRDTLHTPRLGEGTGEKKEIKMKMVALMIMKNQKIMMIAVNWFQRSNLDLM